MRSGIPGCFGKPHGERAEIRGSIAAAGPPFLKSCDRRVQVCNRRERALTQQ